MAFFVIFDDFLDPLTRISTNFDHFGQISKKGQKRVLQEYGIYFKKTTLFGAENHFFWTTF
jgi:hypothetical protein